MFDSADQGVLLIDEAYALARGGESDFGQEAIDTIVKLVEDRRDRSSSSSPATPRRCGEFVDANPGLRSRFPKTIHFPDYSNDELMPIFESLGEKAQLLAATTAPAGGAAPGSRPAPRQGFGNGRLARNLFEAAVARQASRLVTIENPTDEQLTTLTAEDIPGPEEAGQRHHVKRVLAVVVAALLIAGAVLVRNALDDRRRRHRRRGPGGERRVRPRARGGVRRVRLRHRERLYDRHRRRLTATSDVDAWLTLDPWPAVGSAQGAVFGDRHRGRDAPAWRS